MQRGIERGSNWLEGAQLGQDLEQGSLPQSRCRGPLGKAASHTLGLVKTRVLAGTQSLASGEFCTLAGS